MAKTPSKTTSTSKAKTNAKKASGVKAAVKKKVAGQARAVKKTTAAQPRPKTAASTRKTPAKKTPTKAAAPKKPASKASKASLQSQLDTIASRLVNADKRTKKNITGLEADFTALAAQMSSTKANHTKLTRRVADLSKTLSKDFEDMQSKIREDLSAALQNPTLDSIQSALARADDRLIESETAQVSAVARINRHIADIANIVEKRLSDEAQTRQSAMAEMKQAMTANQSQLLTAQDALEKEQVKQSQSMQLRFSNLQSESAEAIRTIGDKVVDVAEEMGRRRETLASTLRQELNESTLSATTEFEQFRRVVERRLEAIETDVNGMDGQIDRVIAPLSSRIEGLEYGLTQAPQPAPNELAPNLQTAPPMAASPLAAPINQADLAQSSAAPQPEQIPAAIQNYADDAFSPAVAPAPELPQIAPPQPTAPLQLDTPAAAKAVPYDPQAYPAVEYPAPTPPVPLAPAQPAGIAPTQHYPAPQQAYSATPPYPQPVAEAQHYASTQPPFPAAEDLAVVEDDLPYADPAYAEAPITANPYGDDSMGAARPGAFDNLKKIGRKARANDNPGEKTAGLAAYMTPRNLKLGGLVAAVGVVSLVGLQTLTKKNTPMPSGEFSVASNAALDESRPSLSANQILPAGEQRPSLERSAIIGANGEGPQVNQETIGQYADNRRMTLAVGAKDALSTAAAAGNPAAQLQLGLEKIESGELEGGVELIRAAANQEQPAALYRLAKLYETGQGVGQDSKTARELTERAARGGNRIAMHDLALYYAEPGARGGVEMDMPTAAKWFEKAAERGVVDSQYNLGILFESGQGLPQDMESALMWYSIAGAQGDQMAAGRVNVLRKTLSEEQIARADTRIAAFAPSRIDEEANGIFRNVPWAKPSQVVNNSAEKVGIIQTQTLLNELGYAVGAADGAIGPKTKNAILNFQRNNGLSETGSVNAELIEQLEMAAGA